MSWITKNLILGRTIILSRVSHNERIGFSKSLACVEEDYEGDLYYTDFEDDIPFDDSDYFIVVAVENDEYNFLLQVEDKIKEMYKDKKISPIELKVLQLLSIGNTYKEVGKELNFAVKKVRKIFNSTCSKIAFALGGVFTDEGYVEYMMEKHNLTEDKVSKMILLMESNRRL